jgi:hypothetical protein
VPLNVNAIVGTGGVVVGVGVNTDVSTNVDVDVRMPPLAAPKLAIV